YKGDVIFLHEVIPGAADRSYGIQVAKLAGLPASVVTRAGSILSELERADRAHPRLAAMDDLPLFRAAETPTVVDEPDPVLDALSGIEPDELSPRQAHEALYKLKAMLRRD
ncbi:MAG: MutS-related protein, partial [Rhabdaerophilum sp.]